MAIHTLIIPNWLPTYLNKLLHSHWRTAARLKKIDREMIATYAKKLAIPAATSRRRVTIRLTMGKRMRTPDPDAVLKSSLDGLVQAGLLLDDNKENLDLLPVQYDRAATRSTTFILEDLEGGSPHKPRKPAKKPAKHPRKKPVNSLLLTLIQGQATSKLRVKKKILP